MGNKLSLEDELVNLRITSKQMSRSALKCEKNEKAALSKLKKAIEQGNMEGAKIYGQNAIREKVRKGFTPTVRALKRRKRHK